MNKFTQKIIDLEDLSGALYEEMKRDSRFSVYNEMERDVHSDSIDIKVDASYPRVYMYGDDMQLELSISIPEKDLVDSDDPITLIQNLLVKEYNKLVANNLEEEMDNAKREYENFKC